MFIAPLCASLVIFSIPSDPAPVLRPAAWPETKWVLLGKVNERVFGVDQQKPSTERRSTDRWELTLKPAGNGEDIEAKVTRIIVRLDTPFGQVVADTADIDAAGKDPEKDMGFAIAQNELKPIINRIFTLDFDAQGKFVGVVGMPTPKANRPAPLSRFSQPLRAEEFFRQVIPTETVRMVKPNDSWSTTRDLGEISFGRSIPEIPKVPVEWTSNREDEVCIVQWKSDWKGQTPQHGMTGRPADLEMLIVGNGRWDAKTFQPLEINLNQRTVTKSDLGEGKPVRIEGEAAVRFMQNSQAPAPGAESEWPNEAPAKTETPAPVEPR